MNIKISHERDRFNYHPTAHALGVAPLAPLKVIIWTRKGHDNTRLFDEIERRFAVYQYKDNNGVAFGSEDFFFWCRSREDGSDDLSYVTYSTKKEQSIERREGLYKALETIIREFAEDDTVVDFEYHQELNLSACHELAIKRLAEIGNRKVVYCGMKGRFNEYGFHKDHTPKTTYYRLNDEAVLCCEVIEPRKGSPLVNAA